MAGARRAEPGARGRGPLSSRGGARGFCHRSVLLFVILGHVPIVLLLALVGMLYLVVLDMREETDLDFQVKVWWVLLVLIFNVLGLIAEKVWVTMRRRRRSP